MREILDKIFERELTRLSEASNNGSLEMDDIKKLEILTRTIKQFQAPEKKQENLFENLTTEDLLKLIKGGTDDGRHNTKPKPKAKRSGSDSQKEGVE